MKYFSRIFPAILAVCLATVPVLAQSTSGDISGTIVDKSGAAIGQADVTAVNEATASTEVEVSALAGATIDTTTAQLGVTFEAKELQG